MTNILLFIPMYNCEKQIIRVLESLEPYQHLFQGVLLVDNRSQDNGIESAKMKAQRLQFSNLTILKNSENYNLGGSHKVAIKYAFQNNFSHLVVLHGDDQGDIADLVPYIKNKQFMDYDCFLGARFHPQSVLKGYSKIREVGNVLVNIFCSVVCRRKIFDMGSGLNMYSLKSLSDSRIFFFPDNLTFNVYLLFHQCMSNMSIGFFPLSWKEEDQVSNAKVFRQGMTILKLLLLSNLDHQKLYSGFAKQDYPSEVYYQT